MPTGAKMRKQKFLQELEKLNISIDPDKALVLASGIVTAVARAMQKSLPRRSLQMLSMAEDLMDDDLFEYEEK